MYMASPAAASAVKEALVVVAVCVVLLLHSSAGHQPPKSPPRPPARPRCHYTGPSPSPTPLPAPTPTTPTLPPPAPTPTPAPAPVNNCSYSDCATQCSPICYANRDAGMAKCESDYVTNLNGCYDSCTSHVCPGDSSCVNSGCGYGHCPCDNANATSCCQSCGRGVLPQYFSCRNYYDRAVEYCMRDCNNTCYNNCTQGA
ncbi:hypothetical protein BDA96_08G022400 [Sorghum bicolor]|uniref:Uncharacterized protein n=1 Tax=Sorghum bicolor TaxID=4558 RepID=A0A921QDR2_SORBI|nr:hypothetical protein BDA96_08G022400 [Sorghum bicolor]